MNSAHTFTIKNPLIKSAVILFATTIIVITFKSGMVLSSAIEEIGIITAQNLNMRPGPGTNG